MFPCLLTIFKETIALFAQELYAFSKKQSC